MKNQPLRHLDGAGNWPTLFAPGSNVNRRAGLAVILACCLGCAPDGEAPSLSVVEVEPPAGTEHPADLPLRIRFDRYLDPETVADSAAVRSSDVYFSIRAAYDPVDRALLVVPVIQLRVGLEYVLELDPERLRGLEGERLDAPFEAVFRAGLPAGEGAPPPVDFEADLAPALEAACDCHGPEPAAFPPLTPEALLEVPSRRQPERTLVVPGDAPNSYLLQRVLVDYPGVRGAPMPVEGPLPDDVLRDLVSWIEGLR